MFKNIGTTWILNALQILVLMKLAPFVIDTLGPDKNGVWVTIVQLNLFLGLLVLGVPMASVRYIAEHVARKDDARANAAISTCLGVCVGLGIAALFIGTGLYVWFDRVYVARLAATGLSPDTLDGARLAFALIVLQVAFGFALRLPYGIFDAHGDFVVRNLVMGGELVLRLGATIGLLRWKAELPVLACVQILCMLAEFAALMFLIKRRYPGLRYGLRDFDRKVVRAILSFSVFALLLNVGTQLAFRTDAIVIGAYLPPAQATFFDVGNKFFEPLTNLLIAVAAVVMPAVARSKATGDTDALRHVFLKWSKISLSIVLAVGLYLLVLGPEFLGWWIGDEYREPSGRVLQVLMLSFFFYLPVRGVAIPLLMGVGRPAWPSLALLAMGLVNLALSLLLVRDFGILGVALGTAIPNILFAIAVAALACREVGVSPRDFTAYVVGRASIGLLAPLALLLWLKYGVQVSGTWQLFGSGIAMLFVFALAWVFFVYRDDPYLDLRAQLRRLLPGSPRGDAT